MYAAPSMARNAIPMMAIVPGSNPPLSVFTRPLSILVLVAAVGERLAVVGWPPGVGMTVSTGPMVLSLFGAGLAVGPTVTAGVGCGVAVGGFGVAVTGGVTPRYASATCCPSWLTVYTPAGSPDVSMLAV